MYLQTKACAHGTSQPGFPGEGLQGSFPDTDLQCNGEQVPQDPEES